MFASIIIPSLNEEAYLPRLMESLAGQDYSDYEVILADAGSTDRTCLIAEEYGARIVPGGMPAVGRNNGARAARGEFLLFLDSDVKLPSDFLSSAFTEIDKVFCDLATCQMYPDSGLALDKAIYNSFNMLMKLNASSNPMAASCIFITRRLFNRIGGFDEKIKIAEDFNMVKRAARFRPLQILETASIEISVRRLVKEGRLSFVKRAMEVAFYRTFVGEIRDDTFEYEFANFDEAHDDDRVEKQLRKLDKLLIDAELSYKKHKQELEQKRLSYGKQLQEQFRSLRQGIKETLFVNKKKE